MADHDMSDQRTAHRCEACGDAATRQDAEGIWLCEGDYQHLLDHWIAEGFGARVPQDKPT